MSTKPKQTGYVSAAALKKYLTDESGELITLRRVQQLTNDGILPPRNAADQYHVLGVLRGLIRYYQTESRQGPKPLSEAREEHLRVRTAREDLKLQKDKGALLAYTDVLRLFAMLVSTYRDNTRGIGSLIAPPLGDAIVKSVKELFGAALQRVALKPKEAEEMHRALDTQVTEKQLRQTLMDMIKAHVSDRMNAHLTGLADSRLIDETFPAPLPSEHGQEEPRVMKKRPKKIKKGKR
jgi:flagellar hook-basal body complex protein FliE